MAKKAAPRFGELDQYLFGQATHHEIFQKMGAHPDVRDGEKGTWFTLWAPNAKRVSVTGDFNGWAEDAAPMEKIADMGIFECFVPGAEVGDL